MNAADGVIIAPSEPWQAPQLEALQLRCFPTLGPRELMRAEHFLRHLEVFPEADLVAVAHVGRDGSPLAEPQAVGLGSGFFVDFDFAHPGHTFREIIDDGWYGGHDPNGAWYYGADVSVDPAWRGLGLGRRLYDARKDLVRRFGKRGIVAGGVLPGFARHKHAMTAAAYVAKVAAGELHDSTLTMQLRNGFAVEGVLQGYLEDSAADDWAALIVWRDPGFRTADEALRSP